MLESVSLLTIVILLVSILISMTLHEAMHAFMGLWLGDDTAQREGRITLNPLKHIDLFTTVLVPILLVIASLPPFFAAKPVPFNPFRVKYEEFGAALVGISGPLTNLLLAFGAAGLVNVFGFPSTPALQEAVVVFIFVNVAFFVFNMIPFPPLDGSRVLYAFAPEPVQRFMQKIESFGFGAILIFMLLFFPILAPLMRTLTQNLLTILLGSSV